jgi:hypothetical protein
MRLKGKERGSLWRFSRVEEPICGDDSAPKCDAVA